MGRSLFETLALKKICLVSPLLRLLLFYINTRFKREYMSTTVGISKKIFYLLKFIKCIQAVLLKYLRQNQFSFID
jgi:hypothetical protein